MIGLSSYTTNAHLEATCTPPCRSLRSALLSSIIPRQGSAARKQLSKEEMASSQLLQLGRESESCRGGRETGSCIHERSLSLLVTHAAHLLFLSLLFHFPHESLSLEKSAGYASFIFCVILIATFVLHSHKNQKHSKDRLSTLAGSSPNFAHEQYL